TRQQARGSEEDRLHRELAGEEQVIENINKAIEAASSTPTTKAALEKAERDRDRLQGILKTKATKVDTLGVLLPNLKERFKTVMTDLTTPDGPEYARGAGDASDAVGREIVLHPSADGTERFLTAELSGNYAGVVRLAMVNNHGGGHGS
ncbi:MAG TPA: hypothetical protein VFQ02_01250, partial [Nitrospira sp.]|nr:hypothetical protein [Nitrospira sp.]